VRTVPGGSDRDNPFLWTPGIAARETLRYLDRKGVDAEQVLSRAGISRDQLSQRGTGVTVASQYQFLELAAAHAQDSLLGLHVATEMDVRNAGVPYYLAASSATILEALEHSARYSRTVSEAVVFELTPRNDETVLTARPARPYEPRRQYCEFMALLVIRVLRMLTNRNFSPSRATFTHSESSNSKEIERVLGCAVEFAHSVESWVFPQAVVELAIVSSDSQLLEILTAHADHLLAGRRTATGMRDVVERELVGLLPRGSARPVVVARQLGMSGRSLTRRLAEEGTTFSDILDSLRRRLALSYLGDPRISLQQIAWLLGYSEIGAFYHAFKRWTGSSPGQFRDRPLTPRSD